MVFALAFESSTMRRGVEQRLLLQLVHLIAEPVGASLDK